MNPIKSEDDNPSSYATSHFLVSIEPRGAWDTHPHESQRGLALCVPTQAAVTHVLLDEAKDAAQVVEDKPTETENAETRG